MITERTGRCLSAGTLHRVQRGKSRAQYVFDYTDANGRRRRIALGPDKRVAEMKQRELLHERDMEMFGLASASGIGRSLKDILRSYVDDLATRAVPRHVTNVRRSLESLLAVLPAERVGELRPLMLIEHRSKRLAAGTAARTANLECDRLRACLNWAVKLDLIRENPLAKLPRLKETQATQRYRRRALSEEEIKRFLEAADADDRKIKNDGSLRFRPRVRQLPLWRAMLETGARWGELTQVPWSDVDLDRCVMHLRAENTKAGRAREIPLLRGLVEELRRLRTENAHALGRPLHPTDRVFLTPRGCVWCEATNNVMRAFNRILEAAGIDRVDAQGRKLDLHALRHTLATRLARSGAPLIKAQQILGHADPKLTARIYSHLQVEDLRDAMAGIGTTKNTATRDAAQSA